MAMAYFQSIHNMADLKKEYRCLVLQHHPDRGGDTVIMQRVNTEFEKLYGIWRDKPDISAASTGRRHDYPGVTTKEYTEHVHNEHHWKDHNYKRQHALEIMELVRAWLKGIYPGYKFSVRWENCYSIHIRLTKADFEAFTKESGKVQGDINHHHTHSGKSLMNRVKEVMMNIYDFIMSYNLDNSDPMTDYFHTNLYLALGIESYRQPYKMELPRLDNKGKPEIFKHPEGPAYRAMRRALGKACFDFIKSRKYVGEIVLGEDCFGSRGEPYFWPREYSGAKMAQKRIDKPEETGIRCELTSYSGGYIRLLEYTPEMKNFLERERQEYAAAYQAWYSKQSLKTI